MTLDLQAELTGELMVAHTRPTLVYHYTSQDGLIGIAEKRVLWATDVRFLNDEREYRYTLDLSEERLTEAKATNQFADIPELLEEWHKALSVAPEVRLYVCCFSENDDQLSQWRAYGTGGGYSIGFRTGCIMFTIIHMDVPGILLKCEYNEAIQRELIDARLHRLAKEYRSAREASQADPLTSFAAAFFGQITLFAGFFKHPKFAEEAEWRLVLRPKPHKLSAAYLKFRPGLRGIVPFLEIPIQEREGEEAVAEVVVGPTPHMAASCSAVQTLLNSRGFDNVKIRSSGVPFRDW